MLHTAYLSNVKLFREQVKEYLVQLGKGNYKPLYQKYREVFRSVAPEDWILQDQGTSLEDIAIENFDNFNLGYFLMVYLSTFMKKLPSLGQDYRFLYGALRKSGWDEDHIWLLLRGLPIASILKPGEINLDFSVHENDPYWKLMFPSQSWQRGWLPINHIVQLKQDLLAIQDSIYSFNESTMKEYSFGLPDNSPIIYGV